MSTAIKPDSVVLRLAKRCSAFAFCFLLPALLANQAAAQSAEGTVSGRITNKSTGYALDGAIIRASGTNRSTISQRGGDYTLLLPVGAHRLEVQYTGLDAANATVTVAPDAAVTQDFELTSNVYTMDKFAVKSVREGNAAALQRQRTAINSKIVVAADAYGVPAANPGELIQRLPGVSVEIVGSEVRNLFLRGMNADFITFQVDGNQMAASAGTSASRQFQIEQMGTGNIESVEIVKSNTPDRDANAVAGFVNLITRRGFDLPGQRITLTGGVLWRDRYSSTGEFKDKPDNLDLYGLQYSNSLSVLGGKNNLGVAFNFNHRRSATTQDETGAAFNGGPTELNTTNGTDKSLWRQWGAAGFFYPAVATNVGLDLDFKINSDSYAYLRMAENLNNQYQLMHRWDIQTGNSPANFTATSNSGFQEALPVASSFAQTYSAQFTKKSRNYSINPGVSLGMLNGTGRLDIDFSHSAAVIWYPGYHLVTSRTTVPLGWNLDFRGQDQKTPILTQTAGPSWSDPANYTIQNDSTTSWDAPDTVDAIKMDFRKDLDTSLPAYLKTGVKYWIDDRGQNTNSQNYTWTGPSGIGPYTDSIESQLSGRYGPFPFTATPNTGAANDPLTSGNFTKTAADQYNGIVGSRGSDARFKEAILAYYAMGQVKIDKLTLLGGVRIEQTNTTGKGWINTNDPTLAFNSALSTDQNIANAYARFASGQATVRGHYNSVHPAVQFVYEPLGGLIFRGGYTRSISRAPVANLLPITTVSLGTNTVTQGNP
ncbi:MAG: carboxypeptidase-like regulatory domain-containing protein, partial [Opitutaceae bacterium]